MTEPMIRLEGIGKTYRSGEISTTVLQDIDLAIHAGEFVAIMGASGSGKSTLMHLLGCLDKPTAGRYLFEGQDIAQLSSDDLASLRSRTFGFIFQSYHLISSANATENVEVPAIYAGLPRDQRHTRAEELLTGLGLGDRLKNRPNQLSGGQQQRVSIARALMNDARILLADEPTGALDSKSGQDVLALLKELHGRGKTVIVITHDREVANHADRLIEIRDGEIIHDSGRKEEDQTAPEAAVAKPARPQGLAALGDTSEAVRMALRALRANLFRTVLTLLGIVIGVEIGRASCRERV